MPANPWDIDDEEESAKGGGVWDVEEDDSEADLPGMEIEKPNTVFPSALGLSKVYDDATKPENVGKYLQGIPTGASLGINTLVDAEQKKLYEKNKNSTAYQLGEATGGFFNPIGKLLGAVKKIKNMSAPFRGATIGATEGAIYGGTTQGDPFSGALVGGGVGGALPLAAKGIKAIGPQNAAKKLAYVLFKVPEEVTDTYLRNPQAVRTAPMRHQLATQFADKLEKLRGEVLEGSAKSRRMLAEEGQKFSNDDIAAVFDSMADDIAERAEGVWDDPQRIAAHKWLRDKATAFRPKSPESKPTGILDEYGNDIFSQASPSKKTISTNKLKDTVQGIQRETDYDIGGGKFAKIPDQEKQRVAALLNSMLKQKSPAYTQQMKNVADDTQLLEAASELATSPKTMANVFRRIETDKFGPGQLPRDTLEKFDKRMNTDFLGQAKNTAAREVFDKSFSEGSRNVNLASNLVKGIPIIEKLGPILGATVDRYGGKLGMKAIDAAAGITQLAKRKDVGGLLKAMDIVRQGVAMGDPDAMLIMYMLKKNGAEINETLQQSTIEED